MATDPNHSSQADPRHQEPIDVEIVRSRDAAIVIAVVVALLALVALGIVLGVLGLPATSPDPA